MRRGVLFLIGPVIFTWSVFPATPQSLQELQRKAVQFQDEQKAQEDRLSDLDDRIDTALRSYLEGSVRHLQSEGLVLSSPESDMNYKANVDRDAGVGDPDIDFADPGHLVGIYNRTTFYLRLKGAGSIVLTRRSNSLVEPAPCLVNLDEGSSDRTAISFSCAPFVAGNDEASFDSFIDSEARSALKSPPAQ